MARRKKADDGETDEAQAARPVSRRALVGGATTAVAAALMVKATPAEAETGDPLLLGQLNLADASTSLLQTGGPGPALHVDSSSGPAIAARLGGSTGGTAGVISHTAIDASVESGSGPVAIGALGRSAHPTTVTTTASLIGVLGRAAGPPATTATAAIDFTGIAAVGVLGSSGPHGSTITAVSAGMVGVIGDDVPPDSPGVGVFGQEGRALPAGVTLSAGMFGVGEALGVIGANRVGDGWPLSVTATAGVLGLAGGTDPGVVGSSAGGPGVRGLSSNWSPAVEAIGPFALSVDGVARFSRSGVTTIAFPFLTAVVSVPGGVTASTKAFAMLQKVQATVFVRSVEPIPSDPNDPNGAAGDTLLITLNRKPGTATAPKSVTVAWFALD